MLVIGEKEIADSLVAVRKQGEGDKGTMSTAAFINLLTDEMNVG